MISLCGKGNNIVVPLIDKTCDYAEKRDGTTEQGSIALNHKASHTTRAAGTGSSSTPLPEAGSQLAASPHASCCPCWIWEDRGIECMGAPTPAISGLALARQQR